MRTTIAAAAILLTAACSQPAETAAPLAAAIAPTAVAEPEPTAEPTPAPTPQPTATAEPTPTPQPTVNPIDELPALILEYQVALNDAIKDEDLYLQIRADHSWYEDMTPDDVRCGIAAAAGTDWESAKKLVTTVFHDVDTLVATPDWIAAGTDMPAGDGVYAIVAQFGVYKSQIHVAYVDGEAKFFPGLCPDDTTA